MLLHGKFDCKNQKCKHICTKARYYFDTMDITWFCEEKHLSVSSIKTYRGY